MNLFDLIGRGTERYKCRPVINCVLPQPPGVNVGMAAVDLGLKSFFNQVGVDVQIWRIGSLVQRALKINPDVLATMDVGYGRSKEIDGDWPNNVKGPILYWGDFHHMAQYVNAVGRISGGDDGPSLSRRYLLLDGVSEEIFDRVGTFGSTLIFNGADDLRDGEYSQLLSRFIKNVEFASFRDPISALMAGRMRTSLENLVGIDPALLISPEEVPRWNGVHGNIGIFFGRSSKYHAALQEIAEDIAGLLDRQIEWINWGDLQGFPQMSSSNGVDCQRVETQNAIEVLSHLASCEVVVTDSYHAALLSWRFGIPAVTLSDPVDDSARSVNSGAMFSWRDKRELAGSMYEALEFVVRAEEIKTNAMFERRKQRLLSVIENSDYINNVKSIIEADVQAAKRQLRAGVCDLGLKVKEC